MLQLAAADDSKLLQVCVVDHSAYSPAHLHLQMLFVDRSRSQWVGVNNATLHDLQNVLESSREQLGNVRLCRRCSRQPTPRTFPTQLLHPLPLLPSHPFPSQPTPNSTPTLT